MAIRFLAGNLITSETMLTPSSERPGQVGLAVKVGTGSATLLASGLYTGAAPTQYVIEIDSVAAGSGIGQATFRWRPVTAATWTATGVNTSLTAAVLADGVSVLWQSGGGTECVVGDVWTLTVDKAFGRLRLIDRDRDTEWRSADAGSTVTIDVDLGAAQAVDVVALCDHNLTAAATITLAGNSSASWGAPPLSETITRQATNVLRYLTTSPRTYRYWRLSLTDAANPDGYLRLGSLYLGPYTTLSQNYGPGWGRSRQAATYGPSGALRTPRGVWAQAELLELDYRLMSAADRTALLALFDHVYDPATGVVRTIVINPEHTDTADVSLYELESPDLRIASPFLNYYEWQLRLRQRPRLARSGV